MGKPLIDLSKTQKPFGLWTVLSRAPSRPNGQGGSITYWLCRCRCGTEREIPSGNLRRGLSTNCGCEHRRSISRIKFKHGLTHAPEYRVWYAMIGRCHNAKAKGYERYGGRGIMVCRAWRASFARFITDIGRRPSAAHSLDRINNDGHYEPGNVRWATRREQVRNSTSAHWIRFRGERLTVGDWCRRLGISAGALAYRIERWGKAKALTTPKVKQEQTARSRSPERDAWLNMKQRCLNPKNRGWRLYGGRGIEIDPRWLDSFAAFLADMGRRPSPLHSLDRIDPDGNYEPENCRWATRTVQNANRRRSV